MTPNRPHRNLISLCAGLTLSTSSSQLGPKNCLTERYGTCPSTLYGLSPLSDPSPWEQGYSWPCRKRFLGNYSVARSTIPHPSCTRTTQAPWSWIFSVYWCSSSSLMMILLTSTPLPRADKSIFYFHTVFLFYPLEIVMYGVSGIVSHWRLISILHPPELWMPWHSRLHGPSTPMTVAFL